MKKTRNALLIIDAQNDFCKPDGALFVQGADDDAKRIARLISSNIDKIDAIHLTQDSHQEMDIAHPAWWNDKDGNPAPPFTTVNAIDIGVKWFPTIFLKETRDYIESLEKNKEYPHCIWPPHCIIGSEGGAIVKDVMDAVRDWQVKTKRWYQIVQKGQYPLSEHFGALRANVPEKAQPSTQLNQRLINTLQQFNQVYLMGEAKSHCVANTLKQLIRYAPDLLPKLYIIEDCMSDVTGFENFANSIFDEARLAGANFVNSNNPMMLP